METKNKIRHYNPFPMKQIGRLKLLGYFVMALGPIVFLYKSPDNTPFSLFIEFLLILFGVIILKDCWISQRYWRNKLETDRKIEDK